MKLAPILPRFGAEVSDLDFSRIDDAKQAELQQAIDRHGVLVFRDTGLDDAGHVAFSARFGYLERAPNASGRPPRFAFAELFNAGNIGADGEITNLSARQQRLGDRLWHTDSSFMEKRSSYSLLLAHEVPREGGDTWFADMRSAYDDLPQAMKDRIEHLELDHSIWHSRRLGGFDISEADVDTRGRARHKLVQTHAGSGRKTLYIAAHAMDVVGMPRAEGQKLIGELIAFATQPHYIFSVSWQPGDMVMWDNLSTMHRGGDYDIDSERRDMRRTTIREEAAPEVADDPFGDYFKVQFALAK
jgi:alpha-ketoglutarate-dependent 2,4-dichlorophenoxyacetate dioxygenase